MLHKDLLMTLCQARDKLQETPDPPLSIRQIAAETGMSLFHFIRLFKAVFGETPTAYREKYCPLVSTPGELPIQLAREGFGRN